MSPGDDNKKWVIFVLVFVVFWLLLYLLVSAADLQEAVAELAHSEMPLRAPGAPGA
jgi:hypothetical protein